MEGMAYLLVPRTLTLNTYLKLTLNPNRNPMFYSYQARQKVEKRQNVPCSFSQSL